MKKEKIFIEASNIAVIKGVCMKTAWKELNLVRKYFNKSKRQVVTIPEYSKYTGLDESDIRRIINS